MTPETLLLIAQLATGEHQWQPMDASLCAMVVEYTDKGWLVIGDKADGSGTVTIVKAACIEDTALNRLELIFGSQVGACEAGA
jgi:hypothetical protein